MSPNDEIPPAITVTVEKRGCLDRLRSTVTVEVVMFLYFLSFMSFVPAQQQYVYARISDDLGFVKREETSACGQDNSTDEYKALEARVQAGAAHYMMISSTVSLVPGMVATLFLGHYSDHVGRKVVLLPAIVAMTLKSFAAVVIASTKSSIYLLLVANVLESSSGGIMAVIMACFAYITDITTPQSRVLRMFLVEAGLGLGMMIASVATGYVIRYFHYVYAFLVPTAVSALLTLYVAFYLKESIKTKTPTSFWSTEHIKSSLKLFCTDDGHGRRAKLLLCAMYLTVFFLAETGSYEIVIFYLLGRPLCFSSVTIGLYGGVNAAMKFGGGFLVGKLLLKRCPSTIVMIVAAAAGIGSQIIFGFAVKTFMVFVVTAVSSIQVLGTPVLRTLSATMVEPHQIGSLFATMSFCQQVAMFVGTTMFNAIFAATVEIYTGFTFFVCSGVFAVATMIAITLHVIIRGEKRSLETQGLINGSIN